jgi:hypothetical protein
MKNFIVFAFCLLIFQIGQGQPTNWAEFLSKQDLTWDNNIDGNFYHGAFIGNGIEGAMIMKDTQNPNGLRMLMANYKAISHNQIPNFEYTDSRVYVGNIIITPVGKTLNQTMRMNIYDGEASGVITTDKGVINWSAFVDRIDNVFIVKLKGENDEVNAILGIREEWGISPKIYIENKNPSDYSEHLPPKPELSKNGAIDLVINKMKKRGAHVIASQLIQSDANTKILYAVIGTSDNNDTAVAANLASTDAISRLQSVVTKGFTSIVEKHQEWWHSYMESSYLNIPDNPFWEKYWYVQLYKFASASAENSDLIIDTQGTWIWETGWGAIWWNLNAQLSYYPMYSSNKLDAGRSLINGMDRLYKSGILAQNANGVGINIARNTTYEGIGPWGNEFGNIPWMLHCYWKYWKYSGDDSIGANLFPMLKDNAIFLISKLKKESDGKYHLAPSISPEYDGHATLEHPDANYGLMSVKWVLETLLQMNEELGLNDSQSVLWKEKLDNLTDFPTDDNGYRVNADQGFDQGHRHASHLMSIYPYHNVNPEQGEKERNLIAKSLERWLVLTNQSGFAGFTFPIGSSMYSTLGQGNKALSTLNLMESNGLIQSNTMYYEPGGPVIETPLSVVESINYMLLQSWNGIIRIFPAVPSAWNTITINKFRTEGAFLVSAKYNKGDINDLKIFSEKGKICKLKSPWDGKTIIVKNQAGERVLITKTGNHFVFSTKAGETYTITSAILPEIKSGKVEGDSKLIKIKLSELAIQTANLQGIKIRNSNNVLINILQSSINVANMELELTTENPILNSDNLTLDYSNGNLQSIDNIYFEEISNLTIDNLLSGSSPLLKEAKTNTAGTQIDLVFNKEMKSTLNNFFKVKNLKTQEFVAISSIQLKNDDYTRYIVTLASSIYLEDVLELSYSGTEMESADNGILKTIENFRVKNFSPGIPPQFIKGVIIKEGAALQLVFSKIVEDVSGQSPKFYIKINGIKKSITSASNLFDVLTINLSEKIKYGDEIFVGMDNGEITSIDKGVLTSIIDFPIINTMLPGSNSLYTASQSSTAYGGDASKAIDGSTNGAFYSGSLTHTEENTLNPWWMLNLNSVNTVNKINIWNRTDCCSERLSDFYVFFSETPFSSYDPAVLLANSSVWNYFHKGPAGEKASIDVNKVGQYLLILIPGTKTLALAEVEVITGTSLVPSIRFTSTKLINAEAGSTITLDYEYTSPVSDNYIYCAINRYGDATFNSWEDALVAGEVASALGGANKTGSFSFKIPLNATLSADLIKPRNYKLVIEMKEKVGWTRLAEEKVETEINVVASGALSLDYFSEELSKVTIYPNPVLERLNIQNLKNVNISNIKITDLSGKEVQSNIDLKSDKSIDVSSLSSGTYILSVKTENANRFIKFIKK